MAADLIGGRALIVNAVDVEAAALWRRRRFIPSAFIDATHAKCRRSQVDCANFIAARDIRVRTSYVVQCRGKSQNIVHGAPSALRWILIPLPLVAFGILSIGAGLVLAFSATSPRSIRVSCEASEPL